MKASERKLNEHVRSKPATILPPLLLMQEFEEWFKVKKYPHIGDPVTTRDYKRVLAYVKNPDAIRKHSFLPFIHKTILKRKFRPIIPVVARNKSGKRPRIKAEPKVRDTYYASHLDAMIFSRYNLILSERYEEHIKKQPLNESIVAYRKIPIVKGLKGNKCNIDFAKSAFEFIHANQSRQLSVIVADITSFFDNLDHRILKERWAYVVQEKRLPLDHFNIYKALTRLRYVESEQLFGFYNKTMVVKRGLANRPSEWKYVRKPIESIKFFKEKNAVSFCSKKEFFKNNLPLIISREDYKGIPQGSPISATLANIYMLDFDEQIFNHVSGNNGFYQRYSDDLIIVCDRAYEDETLNHLTDCVNRVKLTIAPNKTKLYHFEKVEDIFKGCAVDLITKVPKYNRPLKYLGFSYDGQRVLIKTAGFSKFYRSMKGAFNRAAGFAIYSKNSDDTLFKSTLYNRFTYKGAGRKLIFRPVTSNPGKYVPTKEYYWGNYLSYVYKADEVMLSINGKRIIRQQSRKVWGKFHRLLKHHESRILACRKPK